MTSKNTLLVIMGLCLVAGLLVAGCTQQAAPTPTSAASPPGVTTTAPTSSGLANPASVSCGNAGGKTEIKKDGDGNEYGMCTFSNGTSCDEWALFRNEGCKPFTPLTKPPAAVGMANPASVNCGKVGATSVILKNPDGSEYGMCRFPNGTSCEEWALFRGEGCKQNVAPPATPAK